MKRSKNPLTIEVLGDQGTFVVEKTKRENCEEAWSQSPNYTDFLGGLSKDGTKNRIEEKRVCDRSTAHVFRLTKVRCTGSTPTPENSEKGRKKKKSIMEQPLEGD